MNWFKTISAMPLPLVEDDGVIDDGPDFSALKYTPDPKYPLTPLKRREDWWSDKVQQYDPRPHGSEILDDHLSVIWDKTGKWREIQPKVEDLSFNTSYDLQRDGINGMPLPQFASIIVTNASSKLDDFYDLPEDVRKFVIFNGGWDSSYHDAGWSGASFVLAFGATPTMAEQRRNAVFSILVKDDDPNLKRFKMRQLVRPGD